jgi:TPR repeat protein
MRRFRGMLVAAGMVVLSIHAEPEIGELQRAAGAGQPKAQFELGSCYAKGTGVSQNDELALEWIRKAAEQYYAPALFTLGKIFEEGSFGQEKDADEAVLWVRRAAGAGLPDAQFTLGTYYQQGAGVEVDLKKAVDWYLWAAGQDNFSGQLLIARNFDRWSDYLLNNDAAFGYLVQMAEQGDPESQFNLGYYYGYSDADDRDYEKAVKWLQLSSMQENVDATKLLAHHYLKGLGVTKDSEAAVQCYISLAKTGDSECLETLGRLYTGEEGVGADLEMSSIWYVLAAKNGRVTSQIRCIAIYEKGLGVERDLVEAFAWALVVANDGDRSYKQKLEPALSVGEQTKAYKRCRTLTIDIRKLKQAGE